MKSRRWQDLILQQFDERQTQSIVVVDPDCLMQDDVLISELQARRYDILNFTSEIAFRNEFEERYRSRWDRGQKTHIVVIVHSSEASITFDRRELIAQLKSGSTIGSIL
jgi:hypothetical protein